METKAKRFGLGIGIIALIIYLKFFVFNKSEEKEEHEKERSSPYSEVKAHILDPQLLYKDRFVYFTLPSNSYEPGIVRYGAGNLIIQVHGRDYVWEEGKKPFPARIKYTTFGLKIPPDSQKQSLRVDVTAVKKINQ